MTRVEETHDSHFDVIIVGAGISGIDTAYRLQTQMPELSYTILEARAGIGGTWDFFKYPGIRSDSDLHTFGFPWRPWTEQKAIADGASIVNYIKETAAIHGIDRHVQYRHKLVSANWSSDQQAWTLSVNAEDEERKKIFLARFIVLSTGYYDYAEALPAIIPGIENFEGKIVHPQFWPEDLDYSDKKMVVIGSGATAVTLLPVLAEKAARVTMLQRSPGYIMSLPAEDPFGSWAKRWLPAWIAFKLIRLKFIILPFLFFNFCRLFPNAARTVLKKETIKQLPKTLAYNPHFEPMYNPWDQRVCFCPDGDFYRAFHRGKADVVTGHIKTVTDKGIVLESGQTLDADIIVTATGLKVQIAGGAQLSVDGEPLEISEKFLWKGVMLQDLPNAAFVIGYTNASWTLGADATALLICRLLKRMKKKGATSVVPYIEDPSTLKALPVLNLTSTYLQRATGALPKAGDSGPWRARSNYFKDSYNAQFGDISTGLRFSRVSVD